MKSIALPSWTNRFFTGWKPVRERASIVIGRSHITAARIASDAAADPLRWVHEASPGLSLFEGTPESQHLSGLTAALKSIAGELAVYLPTQVALPDTAIQFRVYELDELPKGEKLQSALVRWRLANDLGVPEEALYVTCQSMGQKNGKYLLLAQSMMKSWRECLLQAFDHAGIVPWAMNSGTIYRFNYYLDTLKEPPGGAAAMIALDADSWSVSFWDKEFRLRWMRSRWHESVDPAWKEDLNAYFRKLLPELERTIVSYVHGEAERAVGRIFVAGEMTSVLDFKEILDRRLHASSIPLVVEAGPASAGDPPATRWQRALAYVVAQGKKDA